MKHFTRQTIAFAAGAVAVAGLGLEGVSDPVGVVEQPVAKFVQPAAAALEAEGFPGGLVAADPRHGGGDAYEKPLYQVLGLDEPGAVSSPRRGGMRSAGDILRAVLGSSGGKP